jgi:hypothetical protein
VKASDIEKAGELSKDLADAKSQVDRLAEFDQGWNTETGREITAIVYAGPPGCGGSKAEVHVVGRDETSQFVKALAVYAAARVARLEAELRALGVEL